uniref:Microfibril associated protein 2 n=1 Tax=Oryzias latipes TaxID=8090 RepID=H2MVT2_ORYLA
LFLPQELSSSTDIWDCREEQYPCTRLYSVHKPCKQCLNSLCFYSVRRMYVINKEICVRTVCAHEELLRVSPFLIFGCWCAAGFLSRRKCACNRTLQKHCNREPLGCGGDQHHGCAADKICSNCVMLS